MADTRVSATDTTDMTNKVADYSVDVSEQDQPGTRYTPKWSKWFGYYKVIPELHAAITKVAIWTVGKGYIAEEKVKTRLNRIRGNGKDTFDSIIFNMQVAKKIGGDAFAEIIRNKRGELINLKPINPGSMVIKSNSKGIITGYEQAVIPSGEDTVRSNKNPIPFKTNQIFHLMNNRLGDEPHGRSTIEKLETIILMKNEAQTDMKVVFHRYVKPLIISQIDSDDKEEIEKYKNDLDKAVANAENLIIPLDSVKMERMSIPQYSTLDPIPWIRLLQEYFIISEGVPEVILGSGRETTEASSKILYLAFQQNIEHEQLYLEQQIKAQLKLDVEFNFPADLSEHMKGDMRKEGNVGFEGNRPKSQGKPTGKAGSQRASRTPGNA